MKHALCIFTWLLALVPAALGQYLVHSGGSANASGRLSGADFSAFVAIGQPIVGSSSNGRFGAGFGGVSQRQALVRTDTDDSSAERPGHFRLGSNYPNPFNPATTIAFELPQAGPVRLVVFDALGRQVAVLVDGLLPAGRHTVPFRAEGLPSGVYFYQMHTASFQAVRRMVLLK